MNTKVSEGGTPKIVAACCNHRQVVVALSSGSIFYFEIDEQGIGGLREAQNIPQAIVPQGGNTTASMGAGDEGSAPAVSISDVPPERKRVAFFAVADGANCKVRLYRVGMDGTSESLGIHVAPAPIESIALIDYGIRSTEPGAEGGNSANSSNRDSSAAGGPNAKR